uniref:Isocitrate lyase/phosphoenolpyruvate mutase family protein n=2 Tax=Paracidobacterium acidisoli TaxID=2303751 RepID=A0A372IPM6_9BACT|nr:isocitrate lyase/phosphoenolpyruvate mutase family protein [Paracidobacterium acidisoli]
MTQEEKTVRFRALHRGPEILVLPNAWDVASARVFEAAGFPAIATTSAGIAFSRGYPDGQAISRDEMLDMVARIASAVSVPVTADVEAGYGDPVATAKAVVAVGAAGMNLEDTVAESSGMLADQETQAAVVREIQALGLPLVLNARTDVLLAGVGEASTRVARTIERLNAYLVAGADCVFAPGTGDRETIATLVAEISGPVNVLATKGMPIVSELQSLGVARVSVGSGPARAALGLTRRIAQELRASGTWETLMDGAIPYAELNALLRGARP